MGAGGHPEHFEPKQRSVAAIAIHRTTSKVLAVITNRRTVGYDLI